MKNIDYNFDSWDFFNSNNKKNNKKLSLRLFSILKGFFLIFILVVFFWGFGTLIFVKEVGSAYNITLLKPGGETESLSLSGVFSEFNSGYDKELVFKRHIWHVSNRLLYEYDYYPTWNITDVWNRSWSLLYVLFVFPVGWLMTKTMYLFGWSANNLNNIAPAILGILTTSFLLWLLNAYPSFKQQRNERKKQKIQEETKKIKKKYENKNDFQNKQKMQLEIMNLYKKRKISRFSGLEGIVSGPIFISMYIAVRASRILKDSGTESFSFVDTIWSSIKRVGFSKDIWIYLLLIFLRLLFFAIDSFLIPYFFEKKPNKIKAVEKSNQKKIQKFLMKWGFKVFLIYIFFVFPIGVSIYRLFSTFFGICQKIIIVFLKNIKKNKEITEKKGGKFVLWNWKNFQIK